MLESFLILFFSAFISSLIMWFARVRPLQREVGELRESELLKRLRIGELETRIAEREKLSGEKQREFDDLVKYLGENFKSLTFEGFRSASKDLVEGAQRNFKEINDHQESKLQLREKNIENILNPVVKVLQRMDEKIHEIEKARHGAFEGLAHQIDSMKQVSISLQKETHQLTKAMKSSNKAGQWGELQLRRVVELAGMLPYCDFTEQPTAADLSSGEGKVRPDLVVHLPNGKEVVIDAKSPISLFLEANDGSDTVRNREMMQTYCQKIRQHVAALSQKSYWQSFASSPDFVVLFLPSEAMFSAALEHDSSILEWAASKSVVFATPTTLIALLKAIHFGWSEVKMSDQARQISDLGRELFERLCDMSANFSELGQKLNQTVQTYNRTLGGFESRVLVSARKFEELNIAHPQKSLISPKMIAADMSKGVDGT